MKRFEPPDDRVAMPIDNSTAQLNQHRPPDYPNLEAKGLVVYCLDEEWYHHHHRPRSRRIRFDLRRDISQLELEY